MELNFINLNKSIHDLKHTLEKYKINQSDRKIDFYFSLITLFLFSLIIYLCYKIYKEFQISYFKKIYIILILFNLCEIRKLKFFVYFVT